MMVDSGNATEQSTELYGMFKRLLKGADFFRLIVIRFVCR